MQCYTKGTVQYCTVPFRISGLVFRSSEAPRERSPRAPSPRRHHIPQKIQRGKDASFPRKRLGPGGAVPPPRVSLFSKLKRSKKIKYHCMIQKCSYLPVKHSARVLGSMGESEGDYGNAFPRFAAERLGPFCREQRLNGRPQAVSVRRRRSLTDIDSRAKELLPPQDKT